MTDKLSTPYVPDSPDVIPAGVTLPKAVTDAMAARDAAFDAYSAYAVEVDDVVRSDYIEAAQQRDHDAARAAVRSGKDIGELPSEVERVTKLRGFAVGKLNALAEKVRQADAAIYRAWIAALPQAIDEARTALPEALEAYEEAQRAAKAAEGRYRAAVSLLAYVELQQRGKARTLVDAPKFHVNPGVGVTLPQLAADWLKHVGAVDEPRVKVRFVGDRIDKVESLPQSEAEKFIHAGIAKRA
ncbi:hypothetical protein [Streptomyces sp. KR55]|uniref:hypothetical protein n=1 Tax=Streptomyces sp. KR55 TaxID=3457425 RepID=UPI003FD242A1